MGWSTGRRARLAPAVLAMAGMVAVVGCAGAGPTGGAAATGGGGTTATSAGPGGQPITHGPRDRKAVALTFDSNMTDHMLAELDYGQVSSFDNIAVIDELDQAHVPATFFRAGKWMERYQALPAIIQGLRAKGFTLVTVSQLLAGTGTGRSASA